MDLSLDSVGALLDGVDAGRSARGADLLDRLAGPPRPRELYRGPARWLAMPAALPEAAGPRHRTLRRRGIAPSHPRGAAVEDGPSGTLVMLRDGLSLEPEDARRPATHIAASEIARAVFWSDCVELLHARGGATLLRCEAVDTLDVLFEAYWCDATATDAA